MKSSGSRISRSSSFIQVSVGVCSHDQRSLLHVANVVSCTAEQDLREFHWLTARR